MKRMTIMLFSIIILICPSCSKSSQMSYNADSILTEQEYIEDTDFLTNALYNIHPYTINGFNQKQKTAISNIYGNITDRLSVGDYYFLLSELLITFEDAHTHLFPTFDTRFINLPIVWTITDGPVVFTNTDILKKGDIIVSIGNVPSEQIAERVHKIYPSENKFKSLKDAEGFVYAKIFFDKLGIENDNENVNITIKRNTRLYKITLPIMNTPPINYMSLHKQKSYGYNIYKKEGLGVFYLNKCIFDNDVKKVIKEFFKEVKDKNIGTVAVDVRYNGGGDSKIVDYFLRFINIHSYEPYSSDVRVSSYTVSQDIMYFFMKRGVTHYENHISINKIFNDFVFNGDFYIINSPYTFSSATWFSVYARDNNFGKVIGEPSGNAPTRYGDVIGFTLPNTGFHFNISFKKWIRPNEDIIEDSIYPDIEVYTTAKDIMNNKDPQIEALKKIAQKNKTNS